MFKGGRESRIVEEKNPAGKKTVSFFVSNHLVRVCLCVVCNLRNV